MRSTCSVPDCGRFVVGRGLCSPHWQRLMRGGRGIQPDVPVNHKQVGPLSSNWKGGQRLHTDGHMLVLCPGHPNAVNGKYVLRSHLVMEKKLGRYLTKEERVHHDNEDKLDDRIDNLVLLNSQAEHAAIHIKRQTGAWSPQFKEAARVGKIGKTYRPRL